MAHAQIHQLSSVARVQQTLQAALVSLQQGRPEDTADLCGQILETHPREANALHLLGVSQLSLGQPAEAVATLERATDADPENPEILANLGAAQRTGGQLDAAIATLKQAVALDPAHVQAHYNLGNALNESGKPDEAIVSYQNALRLSPGHAGAHNNSGMFHAARGDNDQARVCYHAALAAVPGHRDALRNMAELLRGEGRLEEALTHYEEAISSQPGDVASHNDRGVVLFELDRPNEAILAFRHGLSLDDGFADLHLNMGNVLCATGDPQASIVAFTRALALDGNGAEALANLALAQRQTGDMENSVATYRRALEEDPHHEEARFGLGTCRLLTGHFREGWQGYHARESMRDADAGTYREVLPRDLAGKKILVVLDQGIGDEIFFLRFLPQLEARGAAVSYRPDARLAAMFRRAGIAEIVDGDVDEQAFDFKLAVADLPAVLEMADNDPIPPSIRLPALAEREDTFRQILAAFGPPPYVGVTWRAGTRGRNHLLFKQSPAMCIARILSGLDVRVVALQRNPRDGELAEFETALHRPVLDLTGHNADLEDMLALVGLLNDYICVSNSNVHLAAARGRICRILVPNPPEFRWMAAGEESPWFPGMRVYREGAGDDWKMALAGLQRELREAWPVR